MKIISLYRRIGKRKYSEQRFLDSVACRNASVDYMDKGYERLPCKEGFVMVNKTEAICLLFPIK